MANANLELVIAGLEPNDPIHVDIGGQARDAVAGDSDPTIVYLTLDHNDEALRERCRLARPTPSAVP